MPQVIVDNLEIPLFRLSLLGPVHSGKTFLANSLVNNVLPSVYKHTHLPEYTFIHTFNYILAY